MLRAILLSHVGDKESQTLYELVPNNRHRLLSSIKTVLTQAQTHPRAVMKRIKIKIGWC